jgi:hypothetical protein
MRLPRPGKLLVLISLLALFACARSPTSGGAWMTPEDAQECAGYGQFLLNVDAAACFQDVMADGKAICSDPGVLIG